MSWRDRAVSRPTGELGDRPSLEDVLDGANEWAPVSNGYMVSRQGEVWSRRSNRLLAGTRNRDGYRTARIDGKTQYVHTLVLEAFVGPSPEGQVARHLNDVPGDDRLDNLRWGSRAQNSEDHLRNGGELGGKGADNSRARLTEEEVLLIRAAREEGVTCVELARSFDIAPVTVSHIATGRKWSHV